MTKLTNVTHGYTVPLDDTKWIELDQYEILFVSYVPGQLRVNMRNPWAAPSKEGSWRCYRVNAE